MSLLARFIFKGFRKPNQSLIGVYFCPCYDVVSSCHSGMRHLLLH